MQNSIDYTRFRCVCALLKINVATLARAIERGERHVFNQLTGAAPLSSPLLSALREAVGPEALKFITGECDILDVTSARRGPSTDDAR